FLVADVVAKQSLAELADRQAAERAEDGLVEAVEQEAAHLVVIGVDQRALDNLAEPDICEDCLGGDAVALGGGGDAGEAIAGLLLVGLREDLAQVSEGETLVAENRGERHRRGSGCVHGARVLCRACPATDQSEVRGLFFTTCRCCLLSARPTA